MKKPFAPLVLLLAATAAHATDFQLAPVKLPGGVTVFGTVSTDGTVGALTPANLVAWRLTVRTATRYDYTPANAPLTSLSRVAVTADGRRMRVATSPAGNGGALAFGTYAPEVGVHVANYSQSWTPGMGFAMYVYGADFEYLDIPESPTGWRTVAQAPLGSAVFKLVPVNFLGGAVMSGSITTDGSTGTLSPTQMRDWHITVKRNDDVVYYQDGTGSNSQVLPATTGLSTDGSTLFVARPGGYLGFGVPGLHTRGAVPADFSASAPPKGQAGYLDPYTVQYVPLRFGGTLYPAGQALP
jgi:hypothetical protein